MKIAILNLYQNLVERGAETYIRELSKRLSKKNQVDTISGEKLPPKRWPVLWRAFLDPSGISIALFTLKKLPLFWRKKYDIIMPTNGGWQPAIIRIFTWFRGGKMVIPGFSGMGWDDRNNLWSFPDYFVALSTKAARWAKKVNPFVKIKYIPGGVDLEKFTPEGEKFRTSLKKPIIVCVGALEAEKRINLAVEAVAKLKNVSLMVIGQGPLKNELKEQGEKLLADRFHLTSIDYKNMPKVYRLADVFTIPSKPYYSFEIVLVEALASGLPVVANKDEIRKEIVGEAGLLVNPTNIHKYADTLKKAIKLGKSEKSRKQAEKFSWDKITNKYKSIFQEVTS